MSDSPSSTGQDTTGDPIADLNSIISRSTVMLRKGGPVTREAASGLAVTHIWLMPHGNEAPVDMPRVDVHFVTVGITPEADGLRNDLRKALAGYPEPERLAGGPSYIELGGVLGDQGQALCLIGLGAHLGLWQAMTPATLGITGPEADQMAGMGLVMLSGYRSEAKP